jgi:hypothetical protein
MKGGHAIVDIVATMAWPRGSGGDHRGERYRIVLGHLQPVFERCFRSAAIGFGHHQRVLEDDVVEAGPLHCLSELDIELAVPWRAAVRKGRVPAPRRKIGEPGKMEALWQPDLLVPDASVAGKN